MSRSKRKTPVFGHTTNKSEKQDKRRANRKYRRKIKSLLDKNLDLKSFPILREVSNVWSFSKDGKQFWQNFTEKNMRK